MKTNKKIEEIFFDSGRNYARAAVFYSPDLLADRERLYHYQLHLQTIFLFPNLTDKDRSMLCRLQYLREWLDKAKDVKRFALSAQNLEQFRRKVRQKKAERVVLKRRLARSGWKRKLTQIQLQTVKDLYLSLPTPS